MIFGFLSKKGKRRAKAKGKTAKKNKKRAAKKPIKRKKAKEVEIGRAIHYFPNVKASVIHIRKGRIALGDKLHIKGNTTDFTQKVTSIQIDRTPIKAGKAGQEIGLRVKSRTRRHDKVYKIK